MALSIKEKGDEIITKQTNATRNEIMKREEIGKKFEGLSCCW